jgi:hypothetical protein
VLESPGGASSSRATWLGALTRLIALAEQVRTAPRHAGNDRALYEIAEVFERCGLHPQALYEGLHPLAMEHRVDGIGKLLNSMLGCLQQAGEPPEFNDHSQTAAGLEILVSAINRMTEVGVAGGEASGLLSFAASQIERARRDLDHDTPTLF